MLKSEMLARISELEEEVQAFRDKNLMLLTEKNDRRDQDKEFERIEKELEEASATVERLEDMQCPHCEATEAERDTVFDLADDLVKIFDGVAYARLEEFGRKNSIDITGMLDALQIILKGR